MRVVKMQMTDTDLVQYCIQMQIIVLSKLYKNKKNLKSTFSRHNFNT